MLDDITINDLIKEDFLEKLKGLDKNIFPTALILISEKGDEKMKQVSLLVLSHQNTEEIKNKILHIESPDTNLVASLKNVLEEK